MPGSASLSDAMKTLLPEDDRRRVRVLVVSVSAMAFLVRLIHNGFMVADPLYYNPLGGNLPYLVMAEAIARGDLVPVHEPFSISSPLYPYLLAALYKVIGISELYAVRIATVALDSMTCGLVALLAYRHFGWVAGAAAGVAMIFYGPLIFFSAGLTPVPFTLFFLTAALLAMDGPGTGRRFGLGGLLVGLAAATRPNLLLAAAMGLLVPLARRLPRPARLAGAFAAGVALAIAPITAVNFSVSGKLVLLTTTGGNNFYIGHNPSAAPQYTLPPDLDGDIFQKMWRFAESVEGRSMEATEVSGYYRRKGLEHIREHPGREASLLLQRGLAVINDFEPTTYADYNYQKEWSPILRWAPTFGWLFPLALLGLLFRMTPRDLHLHIPILTAVASVLLFFFIARLRIVMIPSLGIFFGAGVATGIGLVRQRRWTRLGAAGVLLVAAAFLSNRTMIAADTSNEWNKAGVVFRLHQRYEDADSAFHRAMRENPANPNTYRNLAVLYREQGREADGAKAAARADELAPGNEKAMSEFRRALVPADRGSR